MVSSFQTDSALLKKEEAVTVIDNSLKEKMQKAVIALHVLTLYHNLPFARILFLVLLFFVCLIFWRGVM